MIRLVYVLIYSWKVGRCFGLEGEMKYHKTASDDTWEDDVAILMREAIIGVMEL